ncbi:MAG: phosphoribosylamine--glycine ligase [Ignavibacteria bacterium]
MKIFIIGNGGRENTIAWKIFNSDSFTENNGKLYCTLGNPGIDVFAEPVSISPEDITALKEFAVTEKIDFTFVGPEVVLSQGIVDVFEKSGLMIFGPTKKAAEIESSKIFAKSLMTKNHIPTADYKSFSSNEYDKAFEFLNDCAYPVVIKADGLAAGKGVIIANDKDIAEQTLKDFTAGNSLSTAGLNFIIEEYLEGDEISVFVICDGSTYIILPFSQDHKRILENDKGKNTGGMGAVAPILKYMNESLIEKIKTKIIDPVLKAMKDEGRVYKGCLYCGLIIANNEPYVIEFNCRFGDPETQAVLPLIKSDFLEMLIASAEGGIKNYSLEIDNKYVCCVVLVSKGYPEIYETGKLIKGLEEAETINCLIFHSGTEFDNHRNVISSGGRVMSVVGISNDSMEDAANISYRNAEKINFENKYLRRDIGHRQLATLSTSSNKNKEFAD